MTLLAARWYLRHSTLVHLPHSASRSILLTRGRALIVQIAQGTLLKACVVEPDVIVPAILCELVFILDPALAEDGRFERRARAMLLLELGVRGIQPTRLGARQPRECKLGFQI